MTPSSRASFTFHGVGFDITQPVRLEQKNLREYVGSIDADHTRIAGVVHDETRMPLEKVKQLFAEAQTKDAQFVPTNGLVHEVRAVVIPLGARTRRYRVADVEAYLLQSRRASH
jgi:hypothetical protein